MKKAQINGQRLSGELTREEQRAYIKNLRAAYGMFFSLRDAVNEHVDRKKILARAAELRETKPNTYL